MNRAATQHEVLAVLGRTLEPESYLEIGVRDGCTLWVVLEAARASLRRLVLADTWGPEHGGSNAGSPQRIERLLSDSGCGAAVTFLSGRSQETLPEYDGEPVDLVHVDGEHSYDGALADLNNAWALCRRAMVVHDTALSPQVQRAADDFAKGADVHPVVYAGGHGTAVFWRTEPEC